MAIAFDAVATSATNVTASPLQWNHTCTGSNRLLFVGVGFNGAGDGVAPSITGITYNGVAMTLIDSQTIDTVTPTPTVYHNLEAIYYLKNPASGSNQISVTVSNMAGGLGQSMSLTGVDQTNPLFGSTGSTLGGTPISDTLNGVPRNCWVLDNVFDDPASAVGVLSGGGGSQIVKNNIEGTSGNTGIEIGGSSQGPISPAGNITFSWSTTAGTPEFMHSMAAFNPEQGTEWISAPYVIYPSKRIISVPSYDLSVPAAAVVNPGYTFTVSRQIFRTIMRIG